MEILGIGPLELAFIILIALIVVGPRDLGKTAHTIGRSLNKMYRSDTWRLLKDTSSSLRTLPSRLAREAALEEIEELKKTHESVQDIKKEISEDIKAFNIDVKEEIYKVESLDIDIGKDIKALDKDLSAWTTPQAKDPVAPPEPKEPESVTDTQEEA
jgi:Sec-independent protein translocase protein TatA